MKIYLENTLGRKKEEFKPIHNGNVGMYVCGPTVYQRASIGNFRAFIFADLLRRMLEFNGLNVKMVMNITDVGHLTDDASDGEDKVEKQAEKTGQSAWDISKKYTELFLRDLVDLNITYPDVMPKATEHIKEQINLIKILEEKGFTYKTSDGIYFDTSKLKNYGRLAGQLLSEKVEGARIEKNPEKKNSVDFALWKFSQPGVKRQMEWESPWGVGFPGWHIECSAMSEKYLGSPFDIHTGGEDHISVHHPNEMAQTEAARGHNLANWWLHNAFLLVDGGKMSKSLGNTYSLDDLRKRGFDPLDYRYFVLGAHYRVPQNFTWQALRAARQARLNLINEIWQINGKDGQINADYVKKFQEKINDDLDMPGALSVVWQIVKDGAVPAGDRLATVLKMDEVLGLRLSDILKIEVPDPVKRILKERKQARLEKNYELSDKLREELKQYGFGVKDEPDGQKLILQF